MLGARNLLISNAAGAVNPSYRKGELMLFDDHLNLQEGSPLTGLRDPRFGQRFVDLAAPYDAGLNEALLRIAAAEGIVLHKGVYCCVAGPHLETRAEYRFIRMIGCDAVGMSTVPEVIVANQVKLPCVAISVLTDVCDPDNLAPVDIADIIQTAGEAEPRLNTLFSKLIAAL
jgi:purine-nucleoside phosphorylase